MKDVFQNDCCALSRSYFYSVFLTITPRSFKQCFLFVNLLQLTKASQLNINELGAAVRTRITLYFVAFLILLLNKFNFDPSPCFKISLKLFFELW